MQNTVQTSGDAEADPGAHEGRRPHQRQGQEPFAEVSSAHEETEHDDGPEHEPRRRRTARAAVRRGGRHLGAAAGVLRGRGRRSDGSTDAGAGCRRRVRNRRHQHYCLRSGGDVGIRAAKALAAGPEANEQVLGRPAQRRRQLGLAGRVVVVAYHLCMNASIAHLNLLVILV